MWNDADPEQIRDAARFLIREGIMPGGPYLRRGRGRRADSSSLVVAEEGYLLVVLKRMLPCVSKKNQVKAAIDYMEDKITADRFIEILNSAINERKRRPPRRSYLPMHLESPLREMRGVVEQLNLLPQSEGSSYVSSLPRTS